MEEKRKLKRVLTLFDVFCIASGAMISSGLFILPSIAFSKAGPAVIFSYVIAGILVIPSIFAKAELATAMPKAGGVYFFLERSMGAPIGTIGGFASWFSLSLKSAFALIGMGVFATMLVPSLTEAQIKLIAVGFCLFFMTVNITGVKHTGKLQTGLVVALISILLFYIARGFLYIDPHKYVPFAPYGIGPVFATAGMIFVSFGGLTKVCCVAEEVRRPGRNLPLGMFLAFFVVMFLYAATIFVTIGLVDSKELAHTLMPISLGASKFMGSPGSIVLAIGAVLAFVTTANAGILTASRDALAMSRDCLLPGMFQRVSPRFHTPVISIIATTLFMIAVILFLSLENLIKTASTLKILLFLLVNVAVIVMRESRIQSYRPRFRSPLYPGIQIAGIIGYGLLIAKMGKTPLVTSAIFISCSLLWYFVYARKRVKRQAALVHVIERLTAKELVKTTLPDELKEIIIERDKIVEDRFDKLVGKCQILDVEGPLPMEKFFEVISKALSSEIKMSEKEIFKLLIARERDTSTVIRPELAIPHIVVEGKNVFSVLLARCKQGISFPNVKEKIKIVFVLAGSKDERNFHLRALAAIAEIAQAEEFDRSWLEARSIDELRHIILLAERRRFLSKGV